VVWGSEVEIAMRILMLTDFYPPIIGGMELHVRNLGAELSGRGHAVVVVTLWHEGLAEYELDGNVRVYRIRGTAQRAAGLFSSANRRFAPPLPDPETVWALRRIIARERPEVVHAHNWLVYSFVPLKRWSGARLVLTLHDYSFLCAKKTLMYHDEPCDGPSFGKCLGCGGDYYGWSKGVPTVVANRAMGIALRSAVDMFLPVSEAVAIGSGLVGSGLPFQVIPNFVPDAVSAPRSVSESFSTQLPDREGYLLFVGSLDRNKGVHVLLESYARLPNAPPLVLIGAIWSGMPFVFPRNVIVCQNWPHDAVMLAWSRSLVGLVPSVWPEPCPTVVMEAMAAGRPVIASQIGGLPDLVIDGETGLLIPPGDRAALHEAMLRIITDPDLRERMGQAGKERFVRFQASTVVPQIEQVYSDIVRLPC